MAEKHIDLIHAIEDTDSMTGCERTTVEAVLGWLDRNPDRVPGRTITESELRRLIHKHLPDETTEEQVFMLMADVGSIVVPDPGTEPTNAVHDRDWWVENAKINDAEDCEACGGDLCPVHYGISVGIDLMAKKIAALGNDPELFALIPDPVKAPGVDDD